MLNAVLLSVSGTAAASDKKEAFQTLQQAEQDDPANFFLQTTNLLKQQAPASSQDLLVVLLAFLKAQWQRNAPILRNSPEASEAADALLADLLTNTPERMQPHVEALTLRIARTVFPSKTPGLLQWLLATLANPGTSSPFATHVCAAILRAQFSKRLVVARRESAELLAPGTSPLLRYVRCGWQSSAAWDEVLAAVLMAEAAESVVSRDPDWRAVSVAIGHRMISCAGDFWWKGAGELVELGRTKLVSFAAEGREELPGFQLPLGSILMVGLSQLSEGGAAPSKTSAGVDCTAAHLIFLLTRVFSQPKFGWSTEVDLCGPGSPALPSELLSQREFWNAWTSSATNKTELLHLLRRVLMNEVPCNVDDAAIFDEDAGDGPGEELGQRFACAAFQRISFLLFALPQLVDFLEMGQGGVGDLELLVCAFRRLCADRWRIAKALEAPSPNVQPPQWPSPLDVSPMSAPTPTSTKEALESLKTTTIRVVNVLRAGIPPARLHQDPRLQRAVLDLASVLAEVAAHSAIPAGRLDHALASLCPTLCGWQAQDARTQAAFLTRFRCPDHAIAIVANAIRSIYKPQTTVGYGEDESFGDWLCILVTALHYLLDPDSYDEQICRPPLPPVPPAPELFHGFIAHVCNDILDRRHCFPPGDVTNIVLATCLLLPRLGLPASHAPMQKALSAVAKMAVDLEGDEEVLDLFIGLALNADEIAVPCIMQELNNFLPTRPSTLAISSLAVLLTELILRAESNEMRMSVAKLLQQVAEGSTLRNRKELSWVACMAVCKHLGLPHRDLDPIEDLPRRTQAIAALLMGRSTAGFEDVVDLLPSGFRNAGVDCGLAQTYSFEGQEGECLKIASVPKRLNQAVLEILRQKWT